MYTWLRWLRVRVCLCLSYAEKEDGDLFVFCYFCAHALTLFFFLCFRVLVFVNAFVQDGWATHRSSWNAAEHLQGHSPFKSSGQGEERADGKKKEGEHEHVKNGTSGHGSFFFFSPVQ
jgi:hypothetical protein